MKQPPILILCLAVMPHLAYTGELSDQKVLKTLTSTSPADKAIEKALQWIRTEQRDDGSLSKKYATCMTAFGIMAHLAAGITLDDIEHAAWMRRSVSFILTQQAPSGYFGRHDRSRMYGHGVVTLTLAEAIGMCNDETIEKKMSRALEKAVALTIQAAQIEKKVPHHGGWRYQPNSHDSDMSLSGWQLMSLHAVQQVGIPVPEKVIRNAVAYAKRHITENGGVGYNTPGDHPALRGLGLLALAIGGEDEDPLADMIAQRIVQQRLAWRGDHFFYRAYYESVGLSRARPDIWSEYGPHVRQLLVEHQRKNGTWASPPGSNEHVHGEIYITTMAVLALAVDRHLLPAYQR